MINRLVVVILMILCLSAVSFGLKKCIEARKCPEAIRLLYLGTSEAYQKLREAACPEINKIPRLRCASLDDLNLEKHPNYQLLPPDCGKSILNGRVANGEEAELREFPWMVLIAYNTTNGVQFNCGGTLINNRYVLTAAHCVYGYDVYPIAGVRVGEHNMNTTVDCRGQDCEKNIQDFRVEQQYVHPDYQRSNYINDIALLRLKKTVKFTRNAGAICLPVALIHRNRNLMEARATVAGWGFMANNTRSYVLLKANVLVNPSCPFWRSHPSGDLSKNKLCAGGHGTDACRGDSGGPLMIEGSKEPDGPNRYYEYGIVSAGPSKCGASIPGVYTEVTKYLEWILNNIKP